MLQAGKHHTQPGGIWFGPLPAPPPPCAWAEPERLLVPVSISEFAGGGHAGHLQSPACPVQPGDCSPHAYSLEGLNAALPAAPLQPGAWRGHRPGFDLSPVLFLSLHPSLPAMAHHFWHPPFPLP